MIDIKQRVHKILDNTLVVSIGTLDESGVWVSMVHFVHDDNLNIYWMSSPKVRHSQAIVKNAQVAGTVTMEVKQNAPNLGIQFSGQAEELVTLPYELVVKYFTKRGEEIPKENDDVLGKHTWYKITPTKMELIDQVNFGFKKQTVI